MDRHYMNSRDMCICCFRPPRDGDELAVHHISYFPEVCCYVHARCHEDIHDTPSKHPYLIQYEEGDNAKFYEMRMFGPETRPWGSRGRSRKRRGGRRRGRWGEDGGGGGRRDGRRGREGEDGGAGRGRGEGGWRQHRR